MGNRGINRVRIAARHGDAHSCRHQIAESDGNARELDDVMIGDAEAQHHGKHRYAGDTRIAGKQVNHQVCKEIDEYVHQEEALFKVRHARKAQIFCHGSTHDGAHQQKSRPIKRSKNAFPMIREKGLSGCQQRKCHGWALYHAHPTLPEHSRVAQ